MDDFLNSIDKTDFNTNEKTDFTINTETISPPSEYFGYLKYYFKQPIIFNFESSAKIIKNTYSHTIYTTNSNDYKSLALIAKTMSQNDSNIIKYLNIKIFSGLKVVDNNGRTCILNDNDFYNIKVMINGYMKKPNNNEIKFLWKIMQAIKI